MSDNKLIWSNTISKLDFFNGRVSSGNNLYVDQLNRIFISNERGIIKLKFNELITDGKIVDDFISTTTIDSTFPDLDSVFLDKNVWKQLKLNSKESKTRNLLNSRNKLTITATRNS